MRRIVPRLLTILLLLGSISSFTGCVVVPPRHAHAGQVWVPGHWAPHHIWVDGRWRRR